MKWHKQPSAYYTHSRHSSDWGVAQEGHVTGKSFGKKLKMKMGKNVCTKSRSKPCVMLDYRKDRDCKDPGSLIFNHLTPPPYAAHGSVPVHNSRLVTDKFLICLGTWSRVNYQGDSGDFVTLFVGIRTNRSRPNCIIMLPGPSIVYNLRFAQLCISFWEMVRWQNDSAV